MARSILKTRREFLASASLAAGAAAGLSFPAPAWPSGPSSSTGATSS